MQKLWIQGAWTDTQGGGTRCIINPATLAAVDDVTEGTAQDARRAAAVALQAQPAWWALPAIERGKHLHQAAAALRDDAATLSQLLTLEGGKPRIENVDEVEWSAACLDYYAEIGRNTMGRTLAPVAANQLNFTIKEPLGVVAAIVPFNYPLLLLIWKIAPALAAGNTVVIKPSELTPLATLRMISRAFGHFPAGVVNVVTGDGPTVGEAWVDDPHVACIAFTGSTAVGVHIASRAAAYVKRVNLELGGLDPLIVCEDADLDIAVAGTAWARFLNAGQVCTSAKRIYVVKSVADAFIERLLTHVAQLKVGDGMDPTTDVGPLISAAARARVDAQVQRAVHEGANVRAGGAALPTAGVGHFYAPTVLTQVQPQHTVVREEVFGPVAAIQVARDVDDAIALAAQSAQGLGASIFTKNMTYAMQAMHSIKAGTFWINDPLTDNDAAPFGGMRQSGQGRELGEEGLDAFRDTKHVHMDYVPQKKPYWFPNATRRHEIP